MSGNRNVKEVARARRRLHIRKDLGGTTTRPRLVVFRSNKHIYAQIVDDTQGVTLLGVSSKTKDLQAELAGTKSKVECARLVGKYIAKMAQEKKINSIVFDRAGYLYHGRVKALADGAREGGLEF